ncbi:MAG: hybrid sensor histidine kinase/response regulator [Campylobacterota bacterium]|nr:hybrid sensor histidine kinase/response regulator [Campylobacterota bacterium]
MYNNLVPKVLIVDDLKDNRLMIKLSLKKSGKFQFFEASDGIQGVELALKELPHIILMDAIMPNMDGFEAIRQIRNNPLTNNIPILMVSALDNKNEKVKALQSGISDFISKPFDTTELSIRVNSLLHLYLKFIEQKKELEEINQNLEVKVTEMLDKRLAEVKMASIGEMAAGITHELNTPVTYMKANLEMLKYDIDDIKGNEKIKISLEETYKILLNGVKRLRGIIDTTREISKKGKNKKQKENLYSTLIHATRMVHNRAKHLMPIYINGTLFNLDINENFETFESNVIKEKMEQVWIVILNNACDEFIKSKKEFDDRKIEITISQENEKITIKFKDNAGEGIDDSILANIFEPFASTKDDKGMGIGLNIAKQIVEQHNGAIEAYNEDNQAVFKVEI